MGRFNNSNKTLLRYLNTKTYLSKSGISNLKSEFEKFIIVERGKKKTINKFWCEFDLTPTDMSREYKILMKKFLIYMIIKDIDYVYFFRILMNLVLNKILQDNYYLGLYYGYSILKLGLQQVNGKVEDIIQMMILLWKKKINLIRKLHPNKKNQNLRKL